MRRKSKTAALSLCGIMLYQICFPAAAWALTGGPSQPEVESFEPVGTSEMVDVFSGDFNYNIPLLDVDGYPLNIAYHSGVSMDQEASWVGLGWNLNPGVINRNMRGLPDDFKGDVVEKIDYAKPNQTIGIGLGYGMELFGATSNVNTKFQNLLKKVGAEVNLDFNIGLKYNNYSGLGIETTISPSINAAEGAKPALLHKLGLKGRISLATSNQDGLTMQGKVGMLYALSNKQRRDGSMLGTSVGASTGMAANSRSGIRSLNVNTSLQAHYTKRPQKDKSKWIDHRKIGASIGSTTNYSTQTYVPAAGPSSSNTNFSFKVKTGLEFTGINPNVSLSGYYSGQSMEPGKMGKDAFGNMYAEFAGRRSLTDFNREKDGTFSEKNPVLAIPVSTHDIFAVSGQGISGMFKSYRNDIPHFFDPEYQVKSNSYSGGTSKERKARAAEVGGGNLFKFGKNLAFNHHTVKSGGWFDGNRLISRMALGMANPAQPTFEPAYFRSMGEKSEVSAAAMNNIRYFSLNNPLRAKLEETGSGIITGKETKSSENALCYGDEGNSASVTGTTSKFVERQKRNTMISYRTVQDADFCLSPSIAYQSNLSNPNASPLASLARSNGVLNKPHHVSEISMYKSDGSRYVYGIAAYNNKQYDITFTNARKPGGSSKPTVYCQTGEVGYTMEELLNPDEEDITERDHPGMDHSFNQTCLPRYAHSYLLTDVLSADYVDAGPPGPDPGDYGSYTHITYYKVHENYPWRVPYTANRAAYNPVLKSNDMDDNANVIYGEKQVWLVAKIEGKTQYALFHISPRADAHGALGQHGGLNESAPSYKLDRIELFSLNDQETPIKTVHFEYDYSLCPGVDNNHGNPVSAYGISDINAQKGKLTLKKIYFTYRGSKKGRFNAYTFDYSSLQAGYNLKGYDRWGNYKPNPLAAESPFDCNSDPLTWPLSNADFPYTDQDKFTSGPHEGKYKADLYAEAWHLTGINLPSGGRIEVQYEADDYAYVQNQKAMQMGKVIGFSDYQSYLDNHEGVIPDGHFSGALYNKTDPKEIVLFELPPQLASEDEAIVRKRLQQGLGNLLYYNFLVNLGSDDDKNDEDKHFEYIRGYCETLHAGVVHLQDGRLVGWARTELKGGGRQHPVALSAWQYARLYMPYLVYPGSNLRQKPGWADVSMAFIRGIMGFAFEVAEMIDGINDKLRRNNVAKSVKTEQSWVRVPNLTGFKKGGGARVKRLLLKDNWQTNHAAGINMTYGQEYQYTTEITENGETRIISSGVASYEPMIGNDENACRRPASYSIEHAGVPDDEFYSEEPFGEAYFPAASVGYSRVEVRNIVPEGINANAHGTGKVVHLFYTAKDFPVFTKRTDLAARSYEASSILSILGLKAEQDMTMSQGFQVELNDMHGKPRATLNYAQAFVNSSRDEDAFSGIVYRYNVLDEQAEVKKLNTRFNVVDAMNNIREADVGLEAEMVMDSRSQQSSTYGGGLQLNIDKLFMPAGATVPVVTFMVLPDFASEFISYKSSVLVRVVHRFGTLAEMEAFEEGSSIKTQNLLLDAETGEVLLTRTYNEYKDPVYDFTMPAHWVYDGMGPAYKNAGLRIPVEADASDPAQFKPVNGNTEDYFSDGDLLVFMTGGVIDPTRYHVQHYDNKWFLLAGDGNPLFLDQQKTAVILESGRKNMQNLPVMQASMMENPAAGSYLLLDHTRKVLNSSVSTYKKDWRMDSWEEQWQLGRRSRMKELCELFNHLVATNQVNNTILRGPMTAWENVSPAFVASPEITGLKLADEFGTPLQFRVRNSGSGQLYLEVRNAAMDKNNSINIYDAAMNAALHLDDADPMNDICPVSLEFIGQSDDNHFICKVAYYDEFNVLKHRYASMACEIYDTDEVCADVTGNLYNPFLMNAKSWHPHESFVYYGARSQGSPVNVRRDGTFTTYAPYWNSTGNEHWSVNNANAAWANWTLATEVTRYSPQGYQLESRNALNIYSSALYSQRLFNKPLAVASNARYTQIGVENLEDGASASVCMDKSLDFECFSCRSTTYAHTGRTSLKLNDGASVEAKYRCVADPVSPNNGFAGNMFDLNSYNGFFNPPAGKYVFSAWVKVDAADMARAATYKETSGQARVEVLLYTGALAYSPVTLMPSGPIVEGWQRIEGTFVVSGAHVAVGFRLTGRSGAGSDTYFDDIRVQPFESKMVTYVYDPDTHRLVAELDENNYASFYEYDSEGALVRVKKETEKGIVTIKEVRSNTRKITP